MKLIKSKFIKILALFRLGFLLILLIPFTSNSQEHLIYTRSFTDLISTTSIEFEKPEGWFKIYPLESDEYLEYDLVLNSEKTGMEIRIIFDPSNHIDILYPNFEFTKTMATIASNEENHLLFFKGISEDELKNFYHADWGSMATFTPKANFSLKERGKLLSIYQENIGVINVIFLYNGSSEQVTPYLKTLIFELTKNSG